MTAIAAGIATGILVAPGAMAADTDWRGTSALIAITSIAGAWLTKTNPGSPVVLALGLKAAVNVVPSPDGALGTTLIALAFVCGFGATIRLGLGVVGGLFLVVGSSTFGTLMGAWTFGLWVAGLLLGDMTPHLVSSLGLPLRPVRRTALRETALFLLGFLLITLWFALSYTVLLARDPSAFGPLNGNATPGFLDFAAQSIAVLAVGEPNGPPPTSLAARFLFSFEALSGLLLVAFYVSLLVARFSDSKGDD